jgi:hypothetical protein
MMNFSDVIDDKPIQKIRTPGESELTLIPSLPHSCAKDRAICCTAAFEVLYAEHHSPYLEVRTQVTIDFQHREK